jgi:hypothetical protein
MRVATTKVVCDLLFKDLPLKSINILDQESCKGIRVKNDHGKVSYIKIKGTNKQLFSKYIWKHLFFGFDGRYSIDNTIMVDDSLVKHISNPIENVILLEPWTFAGAGQLDTYLMDTLLLW